MIHTTVWVMERSDSTYILNFAKTANARWMSVLTTSLFAFYVVFIPFHLLTSHHLFDHVGGHPESGAHSDHHSTPDSDHDHQDPGHSAFDHSISFTSRSDSSNAFAGSTILVALMASFGVHDLVVFSDGPVFTPEILPHGPVPSLSPMQPGAPPIIL